MPHAIRDHDHGEGGPTYRIHFEVTYAGCPAQGPSYASGGQPAEGPEWNITGIDGERWNPECKAYDWVPIEQLGFGKHELEAVYSWAELLDFSDECVESIEADRVAAAEFRSDLRNER